MRQKASFTATMRFFSLVTTMPSAALSNTLADRRSSHSARLRSEMSRAMAQV